MSQSLLWLSDEAWAAIEPHLPKDQLGARRVVDQRIISGVIHMLNVWPPLAGRAGRLKPADNRLQPLEPVEPARDLDPYPLRTD